MKKISSDQRFWLYYAWLFMDDKNASDLYIFFLRMAGVSGENLKGNSNSGGYFTTETAKAARKIQLEAFKSRRKVGNDDNSTSGSYKKRFSYD